MADEERLHVDGASSKDAPASDDQELSQLLDDALQDFGTTKRPTVTSTSDAELDDLMCGMDRCAAQKAAKDFETMLNQLAQLQKSVVEEQQSSSADDMMPPVSADLLSHINQLAERASRVAGAGSEQDFIEQMRMLQGGGADDDANLMPFMAGMMASFLSKEMMYPPVKEMVDKYPQYLAENRDKLDAPTLKRYEKQLDILRTIRDEYEREDDDTSGVDGSGGNQEVAMQRFDRISELMQQMQLCGYPPEELIGSLPPGWSFDASTGLPKLDDDESAASKSCTIM